MKHLCILFCYLNFEHIVKCYESLYQSNVDFFIIENKSENSHKIEEYFKYKKLKGYIQFTKNITNNAIPIFFKDYKELVETYDYVTFSDCDLEVESGEETFLELIKNLKYSEVAISCVDLSTENLPTNIVGSDGWILPAIAENEDFIVAPTGAHLMTLRKENLSLFLDTDPFSDMNILGKVRDLGMLWVKTKINKAVHLTWDLYKAEDDYYQFKIKNPGIWKHNEYSDYIKIV